MQTIIFDLETGPLAESELSTLLPPFDPAEVKTGNLKDPVKIAEKIAEAEASHRRDFIERAALDPLTGRVVAVGVMTYDAKGEQPKPFGKAGRFSIIANVDEAQMLREFWHLTRGEMGRLNPMIGFNIFGFDLPFLFRRSWKHRVPVPFGLRRGRYWGDSLIDLRDAWQLGDRQAKGSLDSIARHLGVGAKNGDGKAFAELWQSNRKQAEAYLRNDIELTALVADALGITA
ncbi:MAG: ribonuclease H-like domain-containing protein [Bryobacteraceae bacterium]